MPRYLTSSTFFYSGIFAAASVWDAGRKQERREQWDKAITELRQEVGQGLSISEPAVDARAVNAEAATETEQVYTPFGKPFGEACKTEDAEVLPESASHTEPIQDTPEAYQPFAEASEWQDTFRDVDPDHPRVEWLVNTGPTLKTDYLSPESIYATDDRRYLADRRVWGTKKLATVQSSMELLLYRIFVAIHSRDGVQEATDAVSEDFGAVIAKSEVLLWKLCDIKEKRLITLKSITEEQELHEFSHTDEKRPDRGEDLCNYSQDQSWERVSLEANLNKTLQRLFERCMKQKMNTSAMLARISFYLSKSPVPPNVDTYNTLLLGFSRIEEYDLAGWTIQSMWEGHMRFNEVSLAAMLDHYAVTNNSGAFLNLIERFRGKHGGTMLANPNLIINAENCARLMRHPKRPEKIIQLPYPTPYVFRAMIAGLVKFAGFDTALSLCRLMRKDGWGMNMAGMTVLLEDCVARGDWEAGNEVWKNILALKVMSRRWEGGMWSAEKIRSNTFVAMLRLCLRCRKRDAYDEIWNLAGRTHGGQGGLAKILIKIKIAEGLSLKVKESHRGSASASVPSDRSEAAEERREDVNRPEASISVIPELQLGSNGIGEAIAAGRLEMARAPEEPASQLQPPMAQLERTEVHLGPPALMEEQLLGHMPPGHELDEYELRERPMQLGA
jgi:hypothetical protein